jgi:hypothetical protein
MSLISQWVKDRIQNTQSVYITRDSVVSESSRASHTPEGFKMPSLKLSTSRSEPNSPEKTSASPSSPLSARLHSFARYNLWPKSKRQQALEPLTPLGPLPAGQQLRTQSSLSDNCSNTKRTTVIKAPYNRNGNLALRRKISVPELREKPSMDSFVVAVTQDVDSRKYFALANLARIKRI